MRNNITKFRDSGLRLEDAMIILGSYISDIDITFEKCDEIEDYIYEKLDEIIEHIREMALEEKIK